MLCLKRTISYNHDSPVRLVLFSDTHDGSRYFARNHFKRFLVQNMDHPNAYLLGVGDQIDAIVPADMKRFQISTIEEQFLTGDDPDSIVDAQAKDFCDLIDPYRERLLGLVQGNHEEALAKRYGTSIHQYICNTLGCENLGHSFMMLLAMVNSNARTRSVTIFGHHGFGGGGRTEGGSITKYSRFTQYYDADIYVTAHDHDCWTKKIARIGINRTGKVQHRDQVICNTGAFMKTLSDGRVPSWAETRGFPPRSLGGVVLDITPDTNAWCDIKIIE
jgi:hypothetical protein